MRQALAELRGQYDFVIVDTPPVLPVTDAVVLATMADAVVLVVKGHATPRELVRHARDRLALAGARLLGVGVNNVDPAWGDLYFYSELLPGWPGAGGWALGRPLALDPYAAWAALGRFSIGLGAFVVAVSYPWRTRDPAGDGRPMVFARLLLTLIAGGVLLACLGLL